MISMLSGLPDIVVEKVVRVLSTDLSALDRHLCLPRDLLSGTAYEMLR